MKTKPTELIQTPLAIPLEERGLTLCRVYELDNAQARQIIQASREPAMMQWVPEDAARRFKDLPAVSKWFAEKLRFIYCVYDNETIVGLVWFSNRPYPKPGHVSEYSYVIRLYDGARGKGYSKMISDACEDAFYQASGYDGSLWLSVHSANLAAQHLYGKLGYKKIEPDGVRLLMIREKQNPQDFS